MFILEKPITKEFWAPVYRKIRRSYDKGHWRKVGKAGVVRVVPAGYYNLRYYVLMTEGDDPCPMGWLWLWRYPDWKGWDETQIWIFPEFRGRGLSPLLYKAAIDDDGQTLYTGQSHTKYTKGLWEKFVREGTYNIHAHDIANLKSFCDVVWDEDEIYSKLPLYEDEKHRRRNVKRDIRLVATKKVRT